MPAIEATATAIATKVLQIAAEHGVGLAKGKINDAQHRKAFAAIVQAAYNAGSAEHAPWRARLFDSSFLELEGAGHLARLLVPGQSITATGLAQAWADSLALTESPQRRTRIRELEAPAADLLDRIRVGLQESPVFGDVVSQQALTDLGRDLKALVAATGSDEATPGTRADYLRWVVTRYSHIDPRGIAQTERQVQVPLDKVFVGLAAIDTDMQHAGNPAPSASRGGPDSESVDLPAVLQEQRTVLLGDPGSGKTTILRFLAYKHASSMLNSDALVDDAIGETRLPILIRVADYAEHGGTQSLSSYLRDWHEMAEAPTAGLADLFQKSLDGGTAIVLLDGLDEIVGADERQRVVKRIDDLVQRYSPEGSRFVVTSRIAGYREFPLAGDFRTFRVRPMDDAQIAEFLGKWCRAVEDSALDVPEVQRERNAAREIAGIQSAIAESPGVRRLASNPLLLTILTLIHRTGATLPQKRVGLYDLAVSTLATTWRRAQGVPQAALVDETLLTRVLSSVAYWLHVERHSGVATLEELRPVVQQRWAEVQGHEWNDDDPPLRVVQEVEQFLTAVRVQTGLLVERSPDRFGFMHLTFEEYYVARQLVSRHRDAAQRLRTHLHDPRWEEPILLALGFVGLSAAEDAADLVDIAILGKSDGGEAFTPSPEEDLLGRDFLFALRCLSDLVPMTPSTRTDLLDRLVDEFTNGSERGATASYRAALVSAAGRLPERDAADLFDRFRPSLRALEADQADYDHRTRLAEVLLHAHPGLGDRLIEDLRENPVMPGVTWMAPQFARISEASREWLLHEIDQPGQRGVDCAILVSYSPWSSQAMIKATRRMRTELLERPAEAIDAVSSASPSLLKECANEILDAIIALPEELPDWWPGDWVFYGAIRPGRGDVQLETRLHDCLNSTNPRVRAVAVELAARTAEHAELTSADTADTIEAAALSLSAGHFDPGQLVDSLHVVDDALGNVKNNASVRRIVDHLDHFLDNSDAAVRVAALWVLAWLPVTEAQLARVFVSEFDEDTLEELLAGSASDQVQFLATMLSFASSCDGPLPVGAAEYLLAHAGPEADDIAALFRRLLEEGQHTTLALRALILTGNSDDIELIVAAVPQLRPDAQAEFFAGVCAAVDADNLNLLAALSTVSRLPRDVQLDVALVRRRWEIDEQLAIDGTDAQEAVLRALSSNVPTMVVNGCRVAHEVEMNEGIVDALIAVLPTDEMYLWVPTESRRHYAYEGLVEAARANGGMDGLVFRLLRERFLSTPPAPDNVLRSLLFDVLLGASRV